MAGILDALKLGLGFVPGGNAVTSILDIASKFAPVLGGAAKGRAEGRQSEANDQILRDRLNQQGTEAGFDMDMEARRFGLLAPRTRMGTAARGSLAAAAPVKINFGGPGSGMRGQQTKVTGGFMERDPRLKQLADSVMDHELQAQLSGKDNITAPRMPMATPAPKPGFIDKALGIGSFATGILGALSGFGKPQQTNAPIVGGVNSDPDIWRKIQF